MTDNAKIEGEVMGLKDEFCAVDRESEAEIAITSTASEKEPA
jgi:hypothetical protein